MQLLNSFFDINTEEKTAVTVGKFDGFHRGHELLLERIENYTDRLPGVKSLVLTFDVSPRIKLGDDQGKNLITNEERKMYLGDRGIDYLLECPFDERFMNTEPEEFIEILVKSFKMAYMAVGADFRFGKMGKGDSALLKELSKKYGFKLDVIDKLRSDGNEISSTIIREKIREGNVESADSYLGYPYYIYGEIVHGNRIGTKIGIPTINQIPPEDKLLPSNGVYLTEVILNKKTYHGITNIGMRPTINDGKGLTVETNLLDMEDSDIYDSIAKVIFIKKVRDEIKFESLEQLKEQITKDRESAIKYFGLTK